MIAITLIVPVYNVEKYLVRCLDSCLHQDLDEDEYEIIYGAQNETYIED